MTKFIVSTLAWAIAGAVGAALAVSTTTLAQDQNGTAAEAKAMLTRAVAALTADKIKAFAAFEAGTDGFRDRDLYPFCFNLADGVSTAGPSVVRGKDVRALKDAADVAFGQQLYNAAQEGKVTEVTYMVWRTGQSDPVAKVSFVTKVGDQGCGVGHFK